MKATRILQAFFSMIALSLLVVGCSGVYEETVHKWHQHYEPIEHQQPLAFIEKALEEAERFAGSSLLPVSKIHLRQSIARKHPARLSRADILDWHLLTETLLLKKSQTPWNRIWRDLSQQSRSNIEKNAFQEQRTSYAQLRLLTDLNTIIQSRTFYNKKDFDPVLGLGATHTFSSLAPKTASENRLEIFNHQLLEQLFPGMILPLRKKKRIRKNIELCEILDPIAGNYVLYVSSPQDSPEFSLQLAHETMHILNPYLYDWYMEGLCSVFAERFALSNKLDWEPWRKRFEKRKKKDPYAISYFMMKEIVQKIPHRIPALLHFAVWSKDGARKMHLDINGWLASLATDEQIMVNESIAKFATQLKKRSGRYNTFTLPLSLAASSR